MLILCRLGWRLNSTKLDGALTGRSRGFGAQENILSIPQMPFNNPTVLEERIRPFVVTQVYAFTGITHDVSSTRVGCWAITDKLLQIRNVVRRH